MTIFNHRYKLMFYVVASYLVISTLVRFILFLLTPDALQAGFFEILKMFILGFSFDFAIALCFVAAYSIYLLLLPSRLIGSKLDKTVTYIILFLTIFIQFFAFAAEFPFGTNLKPVSILSP